METNTLKEAPVREPKQVIVVRKDLGMRKGKMMAQASHASMKVFFDLGYLSRMPGNPPGTPRLEIYLTEPMAEWVQGKFAKIVVGCNSLEELLELERQAKEAGVPRALIQDSGRTEFHGVPTYTALAIGPDYPEKIDPITGGLRLL